MTSMRFVSSRRTPARHVASLAVLAVMALAVAPQLAAANPVAPPTSLTAQAGYADVELHWRAAQPATVGEIGRAHV